MTTGASHGEQKGPLEAALRWHVRLHGGDAKAEDWHAFTRWLEADPSHNDAYDAVALTWEDSGALAAGDSGQAAADPPESMSNGSVSNGNVISFPLHRLRRAASARPWAFGGGLGAAIAATLLILLAPVFLNRGDLAGFTVYSTGIGEQKTVALADGSTIRLNTDTTLAVKLGRDARQVNMQKGEAFFTVRHDSKRPFRVALNDLTITDVGTRFDVRDDKVRIIVSVSEGLVDLMPRDTTAPHSATLPKVQRLGAGQQAVHKAGDGLVVRPFNPAQTLAWQQGQLVFENQDLAAVTSELNRYFKTPVKLASADLASLRFSGVLQITDQDRAIGDLTTFLPIAAEKTQSGILLRAKDDLHRQ